MIGVDTYAEISMVSAKFAAKSWQRMSRRPLRMAGLGAATMGDRVNVPVKCRTGCAELHIDARVSGPKHLPTGADFLVGTRLQHSLEMKMDQGNDRLEIGKTPSKRGIVIDLEKPATIRRRMNSRGLRVLDLASGSASPVLILQDLRWSIDKWVACVIDPETRQVASGLHEGIEHKMHDLLKMAQGRTTGSYDLLLSATPCKGFSGANDSATGM